MIEKGIISVKIILSGLLFTIFIFISIFSILGFLSNDTEKYFADLRSVNIMVKNNAIYYLGEKKEKSAIFVLTELLNNDQPKETRLIAIEALGKIGEGDSVDALVALLAQEDKDIKTAACDALGMIKNAEAVQPLIGILEDTDVRLTAIWALGNIGDKRAVAALTKLLENNDKYVSSNATMALKKIGSVN